MSIFRRSIRLLSAWAVPLALVLALVIFQLEQTRVGSTVNLLAYDHLADLTARVAATPAHVLLVYTDERVEHNANDYAKLIESLFELGAPAIGVASLDASSWSQAAWGQLASEPRVVWGPLELGESSQRPDGVQMHSVDLTPSADGIYRWADPRPAESLPNLLTALSAPRRAPGAPPPDHVFGIRFRGGAESLPHVSARQVLEGTITSTLVRDRIVLLGRAPTHLVPRPLTPTTGPQGMSGLEVIGHALNTLLEQREVHELSATARPGIYFMTCLLFVAIARRTHLNQAVPLCGLAWTLQSVVAFVTLWRACIWLPLGSLMAVEFLTAIWVYNQRMQFSERAWQVMRRRGFSVSPRYRSHPHIGIDSPPWDLIVSFVQHLFPADQVALLVCPLGSETLELSAHAGGSLEDIVERRRDLRREPFGEVIDRKTPLRIDDSRPFFRKSPTGCQYMAPLLHAGHVQGVLVLEISPAARDRLPGFLQQIGMTAEEIAPWVARYNQLRVEATRSRNWWHRWTRSTEEETFQRLQIHLQSIERRLHDSYDVIENASSGKAVFDLSGNVVTMNGAMFRLFHRFGMASPDARLLPVLRAITKRDISECREIIRRTVLQARHERILITDHRSQDPMILVIQPLLKSSQVAHDPEQMHAFSTHGVQLEILEGSLLRDLHSIRDHVADGSLAAVDQVLQHAIENVDELGPDPDPLLKQLCQSVQTARETVAQCQAMLAQGSSEEADVCLPVDTSTLLAAAGDAVRLMAEQKLVAIAAHVPPDLPDVFANPHRLRQAIVTLLEVMIDAARDNSQLQIAARQDARHVTITLENEGCGIAFDRLNSVRRHRPDQLPADSTQLEQVRNWISAWNGKLRVASELGEGACIQIVLPRFQWNGFTLRQTGRGLGPTASITSDMRSGQEVHP